MGIEHYARGFVSLRILRGAEGLIQHLNDLLWLRILELTTKFIVHGYPYHTMYSRAIIEPLQISISDRSSGIRSRLLRCQIRYHIKNPLVLQENP